MDGRNAARALAGRFHSIRESELARLQKKLRDLSEDERKCVEAITEHVTEAIAYVPQRALHASASQEAIDVLVRLFNLTPAG